MEEKQNLTDQESNSGRVAGYAENAGLNENTIWGMRQNHPELVVQDCKTEFGLTEAQCERLRQILMERGVNKWLLARLKFIDLKHELKDIVKKLNVKNGHDKELRMTVLKTYERLQNICKMPRWVEWGKYPHKNMKNNEKEIIVKGRSC